jgi:mevalonate kinase
MEVLYLRRILFISLKSVVLTKLISIPMRGPLFYSKILLFGEYGIIKDSKGLSIPYNFFKGALKIDSERTISTHKSNENLKRFSEYLHQLQEDQNELVSFDLNALQTDVEKGLYFDSSIPQGYGVGSSGALVAAIYDKYAFNKITVLENLTRDKLLQLKAIFAAMESFFHGKSSGLDPLNSYLSLPILINSKDNIEPAGIPSQPVNSKGAVFLLDSGTTGETAPMVQIFMENMKQEGFRNMLKDQFVKHTDACVEDFLKGDVKSLFGNIKQLSKVVLDNFKPMIPKEFHTLWKKGIETNAYYLKLCGSGGGGYMLGFTEDIVKARSALKNYKLEVVYNF